MRASTSLSSRPALFALLIAGLAIALPSGAWAADREVRELSFPARDGRSLRAMISVPAGKGPFPVLVTVHGGMGDRPVELLEQMASPKSDSPTIRMLNEGKWIIFAPGYRNDWFGAEETDLVDSIRYAAGLTQADPRRVGVLGGSNGGRLTLRAAVLEPKLMKCVAAGSPFLANMQLFFDADRNAPPWSVTPAAAQRWMGMTRDRLQNAVTRAMAREGVDRGTLFARHSAQSNAATIEARVLLLTSQADEQVPHVMLQGLIDALAAAGKPADLVTVERSLHGFYWGRDGDFGARAGRGPKTTEQLAEEDRVRQSIRRFFGDCFASK